MPLLRKPAWILPLAVVTGLGVPEPAGAEAWRCVLGGTVREIEVQFTGAGGGLPCEVVYRKVTEAPGSPEVLWTAQSDAEYCRSKAQGLASRLENHSWQCALAEPPQATAAPPPAAPAPPSAAPAAGPTAPAVAALPRGDVAENGASLTEALEAAVSRDLDRLKQSSEDVVDASIGDFGDLNGDGVPDAAVLITFDAKGSDHAQYLVAYVAEDETYRPAASRFIGGRYRKVFDARIDGIESGQIRLELRVLEPDDPYCCPSGTDQARFALQDGQLVTLQ